MLKVPVDGGGTVVWMCKRVAHCAQAVQLVEHVHGEGAIFFT